MGVIWGFCWFFLFGVVFADSSDLVVSPSSASAASLGEILLVGTLDGYLHAISVDSGEEMWQFHTGSPLLSSFTHPGVEKLIPSIDGNLFLFDQVKGKLERVGVDIQELVARAPAVTPDHAWTGSKTARLFLIELRSGRVLRELASDFWLEQDHQHLQGKDTVLIGRADYLIKGSDRKGGHVQLWNMSFGKYIADDELESGDDDGPVAFEVGAAKTVLARAREGGKQLWTAELESQPVAMYRVVHDSASGEAMLVELTARSSKKRDLIGADRSRKQGVHVLRHDGQTYAVPEEAYVAPLYTVSAGELTTDMKTFYNVKVADKTPRLIAPPEKDNYLLTPEESSDGIIVIASAVGGVAIAAFLVWWFNQRRVATPPLPPPPVVEPVKPALKMIVTDVVLGFGSCGTVVYEGRLDGRKIAVKRMLKDFYSLAEKESEILLRGDAHPNVVSYFLKEEDDRFVYLALSYCSLTVGDLFESEETTAKQQQGGNSNNNINKDENDLPVVCPRPDSIKAKAAALSDERRLIEQLALGLAHLHALGVVHRDLKPHNILLDEDGNVKISDMGLARRLDPQNHSFSTLSSGTVGYQAPEVLNGNRQSVALDVWGFGCLAYFVLSHGFHPYGSRIHREANILANKVNLYRVNDPVALHLISKCLQSDPALRPTMAQVVQHPFFWDKHKRLLFLLDVSDLLEALEGNVPETEAFEKYMHGRVLKPQAVWSKMISPKLLGDMGKYRKYTNTIKDLLRLVRNKSHHYRDLPVDLQQALGTYPDGYFDYFCNLFPRLFIQAYKFILASHHRSEMTFLRYFKNY